MLQTASSFRADNYTMYRQHSDSQPRKPSTMPPYEQQYQPWSQAQDRQQNSRLGKVASPVPSNATSTPTIPHQSPHHHFSSNPYQPVASYAQSQPMPHFDVQQAHGYMPAIPPYSGPTYLPSIPGPTEYAYHDHHTQWAGVQPAVQNPYPYQEHDIQHAGQRQPAMQYPPQPSFTSADRVDSVSVPNQPAVSVNQNSCSDDDSRSTSPTASEMVQWGFRNDSGSWSCAHPGCTSKSRFQRGCDLRKHYRRHTKTMFCRHPGCPQASSRGFSSKKDRARHEAKHNPQIACEDPNCTRMFSRVDNMKDHVRRIHQKIHGRNRPIPGRSQGRSSSAANLPLEANEGST